MFLFDVGTIDAITAYILAIVPAVTAIVGMVVVAGVGIAKIKNALNGNVETVEKMSKSQSNRIKAVEEQNLELKKENKELKHALVELNRKIDIIDTIKAVKKEG